MRTMEQMVKSWEENRTSQAARTKWEQAVDGLTVSPTEQAASDVAMQNYERGIQESIRSGRRKARLLAVSLTAYKAAAKSKSSRLTEANPEAKRKYAAGLNTFYQVFKDIKEAVRQMPKGGEANATARMLEARRRLRAAAGKEPNS